MTIYDWLESLGIKYHRELYEIVDPYFVSQRT